MTSGARTTVSSIRERNRREFTQAIVTEARRQLATEGAAGLSLRSVSRELGMASSAIYRYVASRDELVTLLIVDSYDAMATTLERAVARAASRTPAERFRACALALRRWALAHPHEYALVYGPAVPGNRGTAETTRAAARVVTLLAGLLEDGARDDSPAAADPEPPRVLWPEMKRLLATPGFAGADGQPATLPRPMLMRGLLVWVQLFGLISFELFGQFTNTIERTDQFYLHAVNLMIGDLF